MPVDTKRLLADLDDLRRIGAFKTGVSRPTYSEDDMQARHWLVARMREAGLDALLHRAVQESNRRDKCVASLERTATSQPVNCDPAVQRALEQAAEDLSPGRWMKLPSGAGHDAQYMAAQLPTGMLFVPSIGGVSHHWSEDTRPEDLALGVQVLAGAARRLLDRA